MHCIQSEPEISVLNRLANDAVAHCTTLGAAEAIELLVSDSQVMLSSYILGHHEKEENGE